MTSLWQQELGPITSDDPVERCDDVVVGAGLTGLVTALLLARAGRDVVVLEAREPGAVTTGHSTAKISLLQGTRYSELLQRQSEEVVQGHVTGEREGMGWLLRYCEERGVPYQVRPAATYAAGAGVDRVRREHDAASRLGLPVQWSPDLPVPFPHAGGVVLEDQAQLDPMDLVAELVKDVRAHGGRVVTGARVDGLSTIRPTVQHARGTVRCDQVILATGAPILDRGGYFAKLEPSRSYSVAYDHPAPPEMMLISAVGPTRSVRDAPGEQGPLLLVGGDGHTVGRTRSEREHLDRLRAWTTEHFPDAVERRAWSAQDYRSHDGFPYIGRMPRGAGNIHVATGYDKWGMTTAVAAALDLSATILGGGVAWAAPMHRRISRPTSMADVVRLNVRAGVAAAKGAARVAVHPLRQAPPTEGQGSIGRVGADPVARSTVDGETRSVSALCTHLGGVLEWNDAECTWDCPLHGSRFAPSGEVLEGPATRPLRSRES